MNTCASAGSFPLRDTTARHKSGFGRGRASSDGLSRRTVSAPTSITSTCERNAQVALRARGLDTHFASPQSSQIFPSSDIASFTVTYGRPVVTCFANGRITTDASSAHTPCAVSMPARRRMRAAFPRLTGLGSEHAHTTRCTPAAISASQHAPTRPGFEHGSSVT